MTEDKTQEVAAAIGARVRHLRQLHQLSQETLAERAGLTVVMISRAENARMVPSLGTLLALAKGLEVGLADLVDPGRPLPADGVDEHECELVLAWRKLPESGREHLLAFLKDTVGSS